MRNFSGVKEKTSAFCLGVVRKPNNPVPGPRTLNLLKMINFNWQNHIDALIDEGTRHAYEQSLKLCRAGILAGPSSGLNLAGLLRFLRQENLSMVWKNSGTAKARLIVLFWPVIFLSCIWMNISNIFPVVFP